MRVANLKDHGSDIITRYPSSDEESSGDQSNYEIDVEDVMPVSSLFMKIFR